MPIAIARNHKDINTADKSHSSLLSCEKLPCLLYCFVWYQSTESLRNLAMNCLARFVNGRGAVLAKVRLSSVARASSSRSTMDVCFRGLQTQTQDVSMFSECRLGVDMLLRPSPFFAVFCDVAHPTSINVPSVVTVIESAERRVLPSCFQGKHDQ